MVHLANRRPIAFKEALRDNDAEVPDPITSELLIRGYELSSLNLIPDLQPVPTGEEEFNVPHCKLNHDFIQLSRVRNSLMDLYHNEFLQTLLGQAVDRKGRYRPVDHFPLAVGDIVLIKENTKISNYPLGVIREIFFNDIGEVTHAVVLKGRTRQLSRLHSSNLIPYLTVNPSAPNSHSDTLPSKGLVSPSARPKRKAAVVSKENSPYVGLIFFFFSANVYIYCTY